MIKNNNGELTNGNTGTRINPEALSTIKWVWMTPDGKIKLMNEYNAKKWHSDWKLVSKDASKYNINKESVELF